jgi:hypothetical protein
MTRQLRPSRSPQRPAELQLAVAAAQSWQLGGALGRVL